MDCQEYREAHPAEAEEAREHLASCPDCRAFRRTWELIREYPPLSPGPSFLQGIQGKLAPSVRRLAAPLAAMAAAVLVAIVLFLHPATGPVPSDAVTEEQRELAENLDLLENLELLRALEFVGESASPLLENPK